MQYDFGMIGLGTMGQNFLLNVADKGFSAAGLDKDETKVDTLLQVASHRKIMATTDQSDFLASLKRPRKIMLLVPAGKIVDQVIDSLLPELSNDDLIVDGGNSHFEDTLRRATYLSNRGIRFLGRGSPGEEGARKDPVISCTAVMKQHGMTYAQFLKP
ncbi:MAG: NAD(P)-binding domain-containing protein [Saprospiraceae bacterium]